jgi:MFS family permease
MVRTNIPQRLDRLPWSRWHWRIVVALGVTWILDGLEVTIVGALGATLTSPATLNLSTTEVGLTASAYLAGSVAGALLFGHLTDRQGRKKWFLRTLLLYLIATVLTALSWNLWSFIAFRFLTGMGIGGEYAAVNSAIDELIPARVRGQTDLAVNGSWWAGTAAGALLTVPLLNPQVLPESVGWRICFLFGAVLGIAILFVRRVLPESPRWLMTHGKAEAAEEIVHDIEQTVMEETGIQRLSPPCGFVTVQTLIPPTFVTVWQELLHSYPTRTLLGATLMVTQSFLYNSIFFTYALVLSKFYGVAPSHVGLYLVPFAIGNFLGPLLLGRFFDSVGRRKMIAWTYGLSGTLLALTGYLFLQGYLTALTQTLAWCVIFFFASAGASAAYLTVSELFPLEIRATAIAIFFVISQGVGAFGPWLFSHLIETSAQDVFFGDLVGAAAMLIGSIVALRFGVNAEKQPLEDIAPPLSCRNNQSESGSPEIPV